MESGDWMRGRLFPLRSDLSPDGKWLVYLAMPDRGSWTFNAVSAPPSLAVATRWETYGTYFGGGLWRSASELAINIDRSCGNTALPQLEFRHGSALAAKLAETVRFSVLDPLGFMEDEGVLYQRLERDGWKWVTPAGGDEQKARLTADRSARAEFLRRPTDAHPTLRLVELPYDKGRHYRFLLDEIPELLDERVQWACYDFSGALLFARDGVLERRTLDQLNGRSQEPPFRFDLNPLKPPAKSRGV